MVSPVFESVPRLSASARQRGLYTLLADTFLMWAGFFMIIPLLSIYYVEQLGWAAASIGVVLAVRQFTQQGLTILGGALADKLGETTDPGGADGEDGGLCGDGVGSYFSFAVVHGVSGCGGREPV